MTCPLCFSRETELYHTDQDRDYLLCPQCSLVFVPPKFHLPPEEEKARYDLHQNDPSQLGYRRFLSRLMDPLTDRVHPPARGLDFGSGPGPTLSVMLEDKGYDMTIFDKYYAHEPGRLQATYDFITCTEVVEHLPSPKKTFDLFQAMLRPGGWLGVMTKLTHNAKRFANWHYIQDPTHICFFSRETFVWLAQALKLHLEFAGDDVILLQRSQRQR